MGSKLNRDPRKEESWYKIYFTHSTEHLLIICFGRPSEMDDACLIRMIVMGVSHLVEEEFWFLRV